MMHRGSLLRSSDPPRTAFTAGNCFVAAVCYARTLEQQCAFAIRAIVCADSKFNWNEAKALAEAAEKLKPPV